MGRSEDAERLRHLAGRIAALRKELASLRTERDALLARLRTIPGPVGAAERVAVRVAYGEAGEGLFLADLPPKEVAAPAPVRHPAPEASAGNASAIDPDVEDR